MISAEFAHDGAPVRRFVVRPTDNFRHELRRETATDHAAAEAAVGVPQAVTGPGMHRFLLVQLGAMRALRDGWDRQAAEVAADGQFPATLADALLLQAVIDALVVDCAGFHGQVPAVSAPSRLHPLAVAYLLRGSRLGVAAMRRQLDPAGDETLPHFFAPLETAEGWHGLCARLGEVAAGSATAARILADVQAGYGLFAAAAAACCLRPESDMAIEAGERA